MPNKPACSELFRPHPQCVTEEDVNEPRSSFQLDPTICDGQAVTVVSSTVAGSTGTASQYVETLYLNS
jgi:hypothetical protein